MFDFLNRNTVINVHLELSNNCNLRCRICPENFMKRERKFMPLSLVKHVAENNPEVRQYGLSNWGELLLHPKLTSIVSYLKGLNKPVGLSTNAVLLDSSMAYNLRSLDWINFSVDATGEDFERIRGASYDLVKAHILDFIHTYPEVRSSVTVTISKFNEKLVEDVVKEFESVTTMAFQPPVLYQPSNKTGKCPVLFKRHLVVYPDGSVVGCCVDYDGMTIIGDAFKEKLNAIYYGEKMRKMHTGDAAICKICLEYKSDKATNRFR